MFTKEHFNGENFDKDLVAAVGDRLQNGMYTDAVLAGGKYLTKVLRKKGNVSSDGIQLAGEVLGGNAPLLRLNKLQTQSEKDEQKGVHQIVMGFYTGIRNPRTHDKMEDSEEYCIRVLILIDTILQYLNREVEAFDVTALVNRIYEPHFVPSREYAQALVSDVPKEAVFQVFEEAFSRRSEGTISEVKYAFHALVDMMADDEVAVATNMIGGELESATEHGDIANLLRLLKPSVWSTLKKNVRLRLENMLIQECSKGYFDVFSGQVKGRLGSWANTFGRYFERKDELAAVLISKLGQNWYTQNYVAKYFLNSITRIITGDEKIQEAVDALAYAAVVNQAKLLRSKLLEIGSTLPDEWRIPLFEAVNERRDNDEEYSLKLLGELF